MSWGQDLVVGLLLGAAVLLALPFYVYVVAKCAAAGSMAGRRTFNRLIRRRSNDGKR